MAYTIPDGGISLHGAAETAEDSKAGSSSAIILKLNDSVLRDLKTASKDDLRFVTGNAPKLRIGSRTIDLSISPDAFRNELFASTNSASLTDFTFTSIVSHRAEAKSAKRDADSETAGSDAALAALQSSLASYKQEKEANKANITEGILDIPKNRADAAKKEKLARRRRLLESQNGSQAASPSLSAVGTPRLGAGPTSAPLSEDEVRLQAMRKPLVHLLAIGSTTSDEIKRKTNIPKDDLDLVLRKVGKQVEGKWQLTDKGYKELDVWAFAYPSKKDRQSAVDNAIRSYDRLRLDQDDKLWQALLPKEERGKGKVLSRLHLNGGVGQSQRSLTPHHQPSPAHHSEAGDVKSSANTPRLGASTPRPANSKGDVMTRLLSKDPQKARMAQDAKDKKARATEEAREKKRKEREATASDKEGGKPAKRPATKKATTKATFKSAETVQSSDDESAEEGEVKPRPKQSTQTKTLPAAKKKAATVSSTSPDSSDAAKPIKEVKKTAVTGKAGQSTAKSTASPAIKAKKVAAAATGKSTPQTTNGLSAPSSQSKNGRSPSAVGSRPGVPSPLGAARPRVASDVSDRNAVGVQRVRQGAETPKGLGITNGTRKRQDTVMGKEAANGVAKAKEKPTSDKPATNGTPMKKTNGVASKPEPTLKRKASDPPPSSPQPPKHRKTDSSSSLSLTTSQTSPDAGASSSDNSSSALLENITYAQGVNRAEEFKQKYYPAYVKLYDELEAKQARGEVVGREQVEVLRRQHERLEEMKREIEVASRREAGVEG